MQNRRARATPTATTTALGLGLLLVAGCPDRGEDADLDELGDGSASGDVDPNAPTDPDPGVEFCEGRVGLRYGLGGDSIDAFPDDRLTEDASTATGLRLLELAPRAPYDRYAGLFGGLATLDGFGTTAPAFVRLDGPLDPTSLPAPGTEHDPERSSLLLVDIDAPSPTFVEFDWRLEDEWGGGTTLLVSPLRPLRPGARHGLVLTRGIRDRDGDCIAPSETMRALLGGAQHLEPSLSRLSSGYDALLERLRGAGVVEGPGDLTAAIVFTTQTTTDESTTIAQAIAQAEPPALQEGSCAVYGSCLRCDLALTMADFRNDAGVLVPGGAPQRLHSIPVVAYLPALDGGPFPTIVFAHGLDGDRNHSAWYALQACDDGYSMVAIDAPKHGDHPDAPMLLPALDLMGITGDPDDPFAALRARDALRQATFDTLQLLRRIEAGMDVDANGEIDLDAARVHYFGVSLGAVLSPPLLAMAPRVRSATLVVGGVRLTDIVSDASELGALATLVTSGMHPAERERFMAMVQAAIDRGEPEVFAGHVLADRLEGFDAGTPQMLAQMVVDDTIVPNSSTAYMIRSFGLPVVGKPWVDMRAVELEPLLPIRANLGPGRTGGLFQIAHLSPNAHTAPATHLDVQHDPLVHEQRRAFLLSTEDLAGAVIIDPFDEH
jgi:alpha-beta hydrolase superfamily lysophospholipase